MQKDRPQGKRMPRRRKEEGGAKEDGRKGPSHSRTSPFQRIERRRQGGVYERRRRSGFLKRRTVSTSVSPYLDVYSVTIANISRNSISVPINICSSKQTVETLIDCGAGGTFIDQNFTKNFEIKHLDKPVKAYNVDGTENKKGLIKSYVDLEFQLGERKFKERFYVTRLGKQKIILGFPWLHKHNPIIDWKKGEIDWKPIKIEWRQLLEKGKEIRKTQQPKVEEIDNEDEEKNHTTMPMEEDRNKILLGLLETDVWIHKTNIATELAIEENSKKADKTDKELVPEEYHEYLDIFDEEKAHRFPETQPWDHKIEMREGFEPKSLNLHQRNKSNWTNSSKKTWKKATLDRLSHQ